MSLKRTLFLAASLAVAALAQAGGSADEATKPLRIVAVRAMPYYPGTGSIRRSTDLFDPRLALRNVIIGGDAASDPFQRTKIEDWDIESGTTVTYVDVEIESADFVKVPGSMRIELRGRAADTRREVKTESVLLSGLLGGEGRKLHVPFFVYGTGCEPLELNARLIDGSRVVGEITRTIPFACGE